MTKNQVNDQKTYELKTCVLRVSIDCEGCHKRVQKILGGLEGVYTTVVDADHNKVTVTGNIDADKLIKRLAKSGKHAEFIPREKKDNIKKQSNPKADMAAKEGLKAGGDVGKQRKSKKNKKQSGPNNSEATMAVSASQPFDQTSPPVNYYGMSYGPEPYMVGVMDPIRNVHEQSGCFIM